MREDSIVKRLLALLLVSLLVLPLFACASTPKTDAPAADTSTTNTPADDAPADDTPADDTAEADQPADGEPAADDNGLVWPRLANDDVTLTLIIPTTSPGTRRPAVPASTWTLPRFPPWRLPSR